MAAPKGNQFWKLAKNIGKDRIYKSPDALKKECLAYFKWVEENPLYSVEVVKIKDRAELVPVPKLRAMTLRGLCVFLGIKLQTWLNYREREEFFDIITRVEEMIYAQKFEGAAGGMLNANIIARELGLADKSELTGADGGPIQFSSLTDEQLDEKIAKLQAELGIAGGK